MGLMDDMKHNAEEFFGKGKEKAGEASGNDDLKREGQLDQVSADVKQGVDNIRDGINDALQKDDK
ncbi:CsbD family protein [Gulosibacter bifidus]|uniref:CsbD family protein n=1 Tax=Gulosibacter bifidus TaxID=272239 RepID=A0ABW5RHA3_9MICO|nr:CsbD family protein [Gulosibacter bifidus]